MSAGTKQKYFVYSPYKKTEVFSASVSVVLYAIFASYFAGVMVRLMLTLTPIVCVAAAIAFSKAFEIYLKDDTPKSSSKPSLDVQESKPDSKYYDKVLYLIFWVG